MTIMERMFALMKERKITQQEIADVADISFKTVSAWKQRGSNPPADKIAPIAKALGVSCSYLLTGEEEAPTLSAEAIELATEWQSLDKRSRIIIQAEIYKAALDDTANEYADEFHIRKKAT